ncbi:amidohydrolase family protein [Oceaniovalibus sp. ACAM 378]|uniref:amidohydrolase family protein n=1 Tax=Oceaniovalibus sp. ACAM 378 TaxID=2599923 RepID=UPI0011D79346|nr:amidohydrolase family protein [Oceaniovalibus sp. ACAM 378]TYB83754.1 amidohydrolase family protein [Oceaniovalibus sp. ACAM 378]
MSKLLIRNLRPMAGEACDLLIEDGRIARIGKGLDASGTAVEDAGGAIAIPGLIEAHTHLDKTLWGMPWYAGRKGGVLQDLIDNERNERIPLGLDVHRQSMRHALRLIENGTSHIRSHVDIDTDHGLILLEGKLRTREALAGLVDIQIVAFPQSGLMVRPGTYELMDEALSAGADIVGGLDPSSIDRDPKASLDATFALAVKHGKPIDIHLHEPGELGAFTLEMIMERTRAEGLQGMVGVSHGFCLGMPDQARVASLIDQVAELDIRIFSNGSPKATCPSLQALRAAGVKVGIGCDGIRDTWGPWGQPDMLHRARIVGMKNSMRRDDELELLLDTASSGGAAAIGVDGHALEIGAMADLTLVAGETLAHAVVEEAPRPMVIKGGKVVARAGKLCVEGVVAP